MVTVLICIFVPFLTLVGMPLVVFLLNDMCFTLYILWRYFNMISLFTYA